MTLTGVATATDAIVLHWMSISSPREPHYVVRVEGGIDTSFTEVRVRAPDGAIIASAVATHPAPADGIEGLLCGVGKSGDPFWFGPLRASLIFPTQNIFSDFHGRTDSYRVDVLTPAGWVDAVMVNVCAVQID